jgi:hypothetical protein
LASSCWVWLVISKTDLRVGDSLVDSRLGQRLLGSEGSLRILGGDHGLHAGSGVFQGAAGGVQVQGSDALGEARAVLATASRESTVALLAAANCSTLRDMVFSLMLGNQCVQHAV